MQIPVKIYYKLPDHVPKYEAELKKYDEDVGLQPDPIGRLRSNATSKTSEAEQVGP